MKHLLRNLAIALVLLPATVLAVAYTSPLMRLEIPEGFEGPVTQYPEPGLKLVGYSKRYPDGSGKTLMLVSTYEYGLGLENLPEAKRGHAAERYLAQMLKGVEKSRASFTSTVPVPLLLGGVPAVRAEWRGVAAGRPMSGVMYCAIVGSRVVSFHTQDFDSAPPGPRSAVMAAFESVEFRKIR